MKGPGFYGQDFFSIKTNENLIRENLIRVLLTSPGERPMSNFGCRLKDYLFDQANVLQQEVIDEVNRAVLKWEPRITINSVNVEIVEENAARITLSCQIKETLNDFNFDSIIRF